MPRWFGSLIGRMVIALVLGATAAGPLLAAEAAGSIRLRTGPAIPVGGTNDEFEPTLGAEWDVRALKLPGGGQFSLGADWIEITFESANGRLRNASLVPILLNARWPSRIKGVHDWGFGVGLTWVSTEIPQMDITSDTTFAWQVFLGHNFSSRFRGDLRFVAGENPGKDGLVFFQWGYRL